MRFVIPRRPKWCNRSITQLWRQTISCKKKKKRKKKRSGVRTEVSLNVFQNSPGDPVGSSRLESPGSWRWFLPVVTDLNRQSKEFSGCWEFYKSFVLFRRERERESGEKYLGGNLWRQEIKTPCCEDLKKKKQGANWVRFTGKFPAQSQPRGEESRPGSFHGNDEREMSRLYIHVSIRLKALCVRDTLSNINRLTSCDTGWEMMTRRRF